MSNEKQLIPISELNKKDVNKLLSDTVYRRFGPVCCSSCGKKNGFIRRIFRVTGVMEDKYSDNTTQGLLKHYFLHQLKIKYIFFRKNKKCYA